MPRIPSEETRAKKIRTAARRAFKTLGKANILAKANYRCCNGCASAGLEEAAARADKPLLGAAYWHEQADDHLADGGDLWVGYFDLHGGERTAAVGEAVAAALRAEGLTVEWDGDGGKKICVKNPAPCWNCGGKGGPGACHVCSNTEDAEFIARTK